MMVIQVDNVPQTIYYIVVCVSCPSVHNIRYRARAYARLEKNSKLYKYAHLLTSFDTAHVEGSVLPACNTLLRTAPEGSTR